MTLTTDPVTTPGRISDTASPNGGFRELASLRKHGPAPRFQACEIIDRALFDPYRHGRQQSIHPKLRHTCRHNGRHNF
ncbi:MAG: hypothetical protein ACPG4T_18965 [Nannocystaceae bacterium]